VFIIFQVTVVHVTAQIVYLYVVISSSSPTTPSASKTLLVAPKISCCSVSVTVLWRPTYAFSYWLGPELWIRRSV